ncbi:MAG TPA: Gfo/Idh/MocA family oxidoreductase [Ktedonobacterales bacterium]
MSDASQPVTWGVLGAGYIARAAMVPALLSLENARLMAVASQDPARGAALAAAHGIPRVYGDYQALLDAPDIQCVYIALANHQHREWVERAAAAGKHILCEKPLGRDTAEAAAMRATCEAAGVGLMEALMYRFHPRIARALEILQSGAIGEPLEVEAAFNFTITDLANYRLDPALGGGALLDVGGYSISAARFFLGEQPLSVRATGRYAPSGADLAISALLDHASGRTARITAAFDTAEYQRVTVIGSSGALELPYTFTAWKDDDAPILLRHGKRVTTDSTYTADPYALMADAFGRAVTAGAPVPYSMDEAMTTARTLDALAAAARSGERVQVGEPRP